MKPFYKIIFTALLFLGSAYSTLSAKETTHTVKSDEASIEYIEEGTGETIVILPGGGLSVNYLKPLSNTLSSHGYRVIRINPRGAGKSSNEKKEVTFKDLTEDVATVITSLNVGKIVIVGHAYGNRIARMLTAIHPELVKGVVLLAAGGKVAPTKEAGMALKKLFDPKTTDTEYLKAMEFMVGNPKDVEKAGSALKVSRAPQAGGLQFKAANTSKIDEWWAPKGKIPYLVIQGSNDQAAPSENGELLKKDLGDRVTLVTLKDAGHLVSVTRPQEVSDAMVKFLKKLPR